MTVADLIAKLQTFDPTLPVCVADWNEQYVSPDEGSAEVVAVVTNHYRPTNNPAGTFGTFVCIGEYI